nr:Chain L, Htz1 [Saccharomyces cerevisiae]5J9Q_M Chain M, Htz1 [Saccharomyces cerevisiae]5J9Q_O Chain O, Htz1 [Saccharomyces cerevisiae]
SGAKDSGSLR